MAEIVKCSKCGCILSEPTILPKAERKPCVECGSLDRLCEMKIHDGLPLYESIVAKSRHGKVGKCKPFLETKIRDEYHRATGEMVKRIMVIDRENDWYEEVVESNAGKIIYKSEEPLSRHIDHGYAKQKNTKA